MYAADGDLAVLQRLAQYLERIAGKLGQLVQKQHAVVGQGDLSRPGTGAASGHAHGGIVRLPGTDGLFSHDLDLFPSYTAGLYEENGSVLFVTRGLGNSGPSFRVFNRPEIAVLTLRRAEG